MHIPDNYLSPATCLAIGALMVPIWKKATTNVKKEVTKNRMPLLGIGAAFTFLIMMFNIPLPGGTTGHAVGGTLIAILLGPSSALISITIALLIQALLFGDGGILSFGVNCFNMAFIIPFTGYYIFKFLKESIKSKNSEYIAVFAASYMAINLAALFAAVEFGIQPILFKDASGLPLYCPYALSISIPAMMIPHLAVAGILEAIITSGVYRAIKEVSPEVFYTDKSPKTKPLYLFLIILVLLTPMGLLANGTAWGEWSLSELSGVISKNNVFRFDFKTIFPDYVLSGAPEIVGYLLSAAIGVAVITIIFKLLSKDAAN